MVRTVFSGMAGRSLGNLLIGVIVQQAQLGNAAVSVRQGSYGADEQVVGLVVYHLVLGRVLGLMLSDGRLVCVRQLDRGETVLAPQVVDGRVPGDGEYPCLELIFRVVLAYAQVCLPKAFLADILRIGGVGADGLDIKAERFGVFAGQLRECCGVTRHGFHGELAFLL